MQGREPAWREPRRPAHGARATLGYYEKVSGACKAETLPVNNDFVQLAWDARLQDDCRQLVRLALREDLDRSFDWTTVALVPADAEGAALLVARAAGVVAGLLAIPVVLSEMDSSIVFTPYVAEGTAVAPGGQLARLQGPARDLLTAERVLLNFVGHLSGIATLTRRYVEAIAGTGAQIYDTRKTTPGWRRLEKYAVGRGGGRNHRSGLCEALMIKDNHLAFGAASPSGSRYSPAEAVAIARQFVEQMTPETPGPRMLIEVEVDRLEQLDEVLLADPDIVLLDNMDHEQLRAAVQRRNTLRPAIPLEASGGVRLESVRAIAETGVDRISVGALTHSAAALDVALDWLAPSAGGHSAATRTRDA